MRCEMYFLYKNAKEKGSIGEIELRLFEDLYETYHELGGNGTATVIKDKIEKIPLEEDKWVNF